MMRKARHFIRDSKGGAAIEFALITPALVLLIAGIAQLGIMFMANAGLRNAVSEGARLATVWPRPTDEQIRQQITDGRFGLTPANLTTPTITHGTADGAPYADISMSYNVHLNFVFFSVGPVTMTATRRAFLQPQGS